MVLVECRGLIMFRIYDHSVDDSLRPRCAFDRVPQQGCAQLSAQKRLTHSKSPTARDGNVGIAERFF